MAAGEILRAQTPLLDIAYCSHGPLDGLPVVLLHGFPYDVHAYDEVAPLLAVAGCRVIVPWLRGYGPTRFLSEEAIRSGEQAAIGHDVVDLLDALKIPKAVLAGFDWGGRGAAVVAAVWPERVHALVSCAGYPIQNIATAAAPIDPAQEYRYWYQHYFQTERGRLGLQAHRHELTRLLWQLWSPTWTFDEATLARTTASFDNPDFVDVVIHSYRHRLGNAPGDSRYAAVEAQLALQPKIGVPTVVVHGDADDVGPSRTSEGHHRYFTGAYQRRVFANVGHNPPQEAPREFAAAVLAAAHGNLNS
jgi:pimeloyl-ACP methyl ester carboxylesterase